MRCFSAVIFSVLLASLPGRADEAKKDKPANLPVKAKLVAKTTTYKLDLDGMTPERFREALKEAEKTDKYPKVPAIDLVLELANISDKEVQIWISGDPVRLMLELKGKGAVTVKPMRVFTREFRVPRALTLAPGKTHTIEIKSLQFGERGVSEQAYWTEAGQYTLTASFVTALSPPPPDSKDVQDGFGPVTLTSKPIKIKVEAK
jgi:hypothetical protein